MKEILNTCSLILKSYYCTKMNKYLKLFNRTKTSGFISQVNIHANYSNQPISQNNLLSY